MLFFKKKPKISDTVAGYQRICEAVTALENKQLLRIDTENKVVYVFSELLHKSNVQNWVKNVVLYLRTQLKPFENCACIAIRDVENGNLLAMYEHEKIKSFV